MAATLRAQRSPSLDTFKDKPRMAFSRTKGVAALVGALLASEAQAEPWDMVAINSTGKPIKTLQTSPSPGSVWAVTTNDGAIATLNSGSRMTIHFDKPTGTCKFDLRATFSDATNAIFTSINVCDNSYVTLKFSNGKPVHNDN
jgi:hypothetical protein